VLVCRVIFPRVTKHWGMDEVLFKTYVSSMKIYEFGPLLAGREPELYVTSYYCHYFVAISHRCHLMSSKIRVSCVSLSHDELKYNKVKDGCLSARTCFLLRVQLHGSVCHSHIVILMI